MRSKTNEDGSVGVVVSPTDLKQFKAAAGLLQILNNFDLQGKYGAKEAKSHLDGVIEKVAADIKAEEEAAKAAKDAKKKTKAS